MSGNDDTPSNRATKSQSLSFAWIGTVALFWAIGGLFILYKVWFDRHSAAQALGAAMMALAAVGLITGKLNETVLSEKDGWLLRALPSDLGYLESAGKSIYIRRIAIALVCLGGSVFWIEPRFFFGAMLLAGEKAQRQLQGNIVTTVLIAIALLNVMDALAILLRLRLHLYCGNAAEAAEVAEYWRVEGRRRPPPAGPFKDSLENAKASVGEPEGVKA